MTLTMCFFERISGGARWWKHNESAELALTRSIVRKSDKFEKDKALSSVARFSEKWDAIHSQIVKCSSGNIPLFVMH